VLRRHNYKIVFTFVTAAACILGGCFFIHQSSTDYDLDRQEKRLVKFDRKISSVVDSAEWTVDPFENQNNIPQKGNSYFDILFSKEVNGQRVYDVPYPFQKVLERVSNYNLDKINSPLRPNTNFIQVLFPMGRSLQRLAALNGTDATDHFNEKLFFEFPRLVATYQGENNQINKLNLKNKIYLGFHEKSKVIEVISYNDDEARFEFQIVRDYTNESEPKVHYAQRTLCLSCHQNQTPIFSQGPWNESNAHEKISSKIIEQLTAQNQKINQIVPNCKDANSDKFCFSLASGQKKFFYFGAPVSVDLNMPSTFDGSTDVANRLHTLQKMWTELCNTKSCQEQALVNAMRFVLLKRSSNFSDRDSIEFQQQFESKFKARFPNGLKIPSSDIPNRDPLVGTFGVSQFFIDQSSINNREQLSEVIKRMGIPDELEATRLRPALQVLNSSVCQNCDNLGMNEMTLEIANQISAKDGDFLSQALQKHSVSSNNIQKLKILCEERSKTKDGFELFCQGNQFGVVTAQVFNFEGQQFFESNSIFFSLDGDIKNCDLSQKISEFKNQKCMILRGVSFQTSNSKDGSQDSQGINFNESKSQKWRFPNGDVINSIQYDTLNKQLSLTVYKESKTIVDLAKTIPFQEKFNRSFTVDAALNFFNLPSDYQSLQNSMKTLTKVTSQSSSLSNQSFSDQVQQPSATLKAFKNNCIACHQNDENAPPAFLGGETQDKISDIQACNRIQICAARILYRIKMRNCSAEDFGQLIKKNPMPPSRRAFDMSQDGKLMIQGLIKVIDKNKLLEHLENKMGQRQQAEIAVEDLLSKSCPTSAFNFYESLPVCRFTDEIQSLSCF